MIFPDCGCSSKPKDYYVICYAKSIDIEEDGILGFDFKFSWRKPINNTR